MPSAGLKLDDGMFFNVSAERSVNQLSRTPEDLSESTNMTSHTPSTKPTSSPSQKEHQSPALPSDTVPPSLGTFKPTSPAALGQLMRTALSSRNTEDVIADLKRSRHASPPTSAKPCQSSLSIHVPLDSEPTNPRQMSSGLDANGNAMLQSNDLDAEDDGEDDEDENEEDDDANLQTTNPRKLSERKRRLNAIADSHIQEMARKSLKEGWKISSKNLEDQSARYMVHKAESQKIIATPREYQTELFERAKEKNIIAVLNTGNSTR